MITRRALLGTLVGLPLGIKAAQASPKIGDTTLSSGSSLELQKVKDLTWVLCDKFFQHFIYTEYPRQSGPGEGSNLVFMHDPIPAKYMKMSVGQLSRYFGCCRWPGANNRLVAAGIKAIYVVMAEARKHHENSLLITYSVIQTEELPPPHENTIYRVMLGGPYG